MTFRSRLVPSLVFLALTLTILPAAGLSAATSGDRAASATAVPTDEPSGATTVRTFSLRYASTRDVLTVVRAVQGLERVAVDETRNLITVRDTPEQVQRTAELIALYDTRPSRTEVSLALVALDPATAQPDAGPELLRADASIVGNGKASVRVQRSPLDELSWLDLVVDLQAQLQGDEIQLTLAVESALLRKGSENTHAATSGTWRAAPGEAIWVQLPLGAVLDGTPKTIALRVIPTLVEAGEAIAALRVQ